MFHFKDIPLKLPLSCEVVQKGGFGTPQFVGDGDVSDFEYALSNCTYFRACNKFSLSSPQRARRLDGEKNEEEE